MIRPGTESDRHALRTIQRLALPESSPELLDGGIRGLVGLLVADDGRPVGYALFSEGTAPTLHELAVHPARQDEGIGSTLLVELCSRLEAAGRDELQVTALADDEAARRFYARHGFEPEKRLPGYFESGDGVLLVREFAG